jgi:hypothetical protein
MTCVTWIYKDFETSICSSYKFRRSVELMGITLYNSWYHGHGYHEAIREIHAAFQTLAPDTPAIYADGADSCFVRLPQVPTDKVLYSTEIAYWEPVPYGLDRYTKIKRSPWCYLNGGGYMGPGL